MFILDLSSYIGIDLGTTNSCVSIIEGKNIKVIENSEGYRTTPSIVAYCGDKILVGEAAKRQAITNPKNTIFAVKRLIGRKFKDKDVMENIKVLPYKIIASKNGDAWVEVNKRKIAPQQISSEILKKMKKTAKNVSPLVDNTSNCFSESRFDISIIEISNVPPPRS